MRRRGARKPPRAASKRALTGDSMNQSGCLKDSLSKSIYCVNIQYIYDEGVLCLKVVATVVPSNSN